MEPRPIYSKSTLRGTFVFVALLFFIFVLPDLIVYFSEPERIHIRYSDNEVQEKVHNVRRNSKQYQRRDRLSRYRAPAQKFDPNTYTLEQWMALGLSEKQAAVVLKFTSRGIYSNEDLRKVFVISDELFALIADSTVYPPRPDRRYDSAYERTEVKPALVELNSATEEQLVKVRGIGPFFAKQIIRRREQLGGFADKEQLLEVWKMDREKMEVMSPGLTIDVQQVRTINLNTATVEELKNHPYISWNLANSIVKLRSQIGGYKQVGDVKKSVLMTDDLYAKLKPYLTIDE